MFSFLDANSSKHQLFEGLAIQMKNFLSLWETKKEIYRYKNLEQKTYQREKKNLGRKIVRYNKVGKKLLYVEKNGRKKIGY